MSSRENIMSTEGMRDELVKLTAKWVDEIVRPVAQDLEASNTYPEDLIEEMKEMGIFALLVPTDYNGLDVDLGTYWRIISELSRGWMSLGGAVNSHAITTYLIKRYGTAAQHDRYLPSMATGEIRAALAMTEAEAGSDVAAIKTTAMPTSNGYQINGSKMFITNGQKASLICLLARTDKTADRPHDGMTLFLVDRNQGVQAGPKIAKLGYNGIETVPLTFENVEVPKESVLGESTGKGFYHAMAGSEIGRLNVAARAHGVARAAVNEATGYSLERQTFGTTISKHQAVQLQLAEMATKTYAAEGLLDLAATAIEKGGRADMEAGMAKYFATEAAVETTLDAMRIHGGYGYAKEYIIERLYRDAPQMVVAEGTNEIQKIIIAKSLISRHKRGHNV